VAVTNFVSVVGQANEAITVSERIDKLLSVHLCYPFLGQVLSLRVHACFGKPLE
jgi:hypothetical protein